MDIVVIMIFVVSGILIFVHLFSLAVVLLTRCSRTDQARGNLAPKFFGYSKDRADLLSQHALKCPFVNAESGNSR